MIGTFPVGMLGDAAPRKAGSRFRTGRSVTALASVATAAMVAATAGLILAGPAAPLETIRLDVAATVGETVKPHHAAVWIRGGRR